MAPKLDQFPNRQAVLLMYMSDELSAADRAEVERGLSENEALRQELESLKSAQGLIWTGLAELDRQSRPAVPESVASRRASRMIRQWVREQQEAPAPIPMPTVRRRVPWIPIGAAVAAMLMLGFFLWPREPVKLARHNGPRDDRPTYAIADTAEPQQTGVDNSEELAILTDSFGANSALGDDSVNMRVTAVTTSTNVLEIPVANP